jgi:hypothetical protein
MSKRFTETEKWGDPWFRNLSMPHRLLWCYICDNCDNAGVWKVDLALAGFRIGCDFNYDETIKIMNSDRIDGEFRIKEICNKRYWFIFGFYQFQWGNSQKNSVLLGVHKALKNHKFYSEISQHIPPFNGGLMEGLPSADPLKVKVKEKNIYNIAPFSDVELMKLWEDWLESRKKMRIPNTEAALKIAYNKINKWGIEKGKESLRQAIEKGWRGLFEPKVEICQKRRDETNETLEKMKMWEKEREEYEKKC